MIPTMTAAEAALRLRAQGMKCTPESIRYGIEQNRFPFGDLVRGKGGAPVCWVYEVLLEKWIKERSIGENNG